MSSIKEIRKRTGLSQAAFAERFGIPRRNVEDWERGIAVPRPYLVSMLDYLADTKYRYTPASDKEGNP